MAVIKPFCGLLPTVENVKKVAAVPYDPSDERWQNAIIRWADPHHNLLEVFLPEPYFKVPDPVLNDLGLPDKEFHTTGDLCAGCLICIQIPSDIGYGPGYIQRLRIGQAIRGGSLTRRLRRLLR